VVFFKNSGVQLTEDQQNWELASLKVSKFAAPSTPTNTNRYLVGIKRNHFDGTQGTEVVGEWTNSTGTFVPPYWWFVFSDTYVSLSTYLVGYVARVRA
jgi:hypothetical protein